MQRPSAKPLAARIFTPCLELADNGLSPVIRRALQRLYDALVELDKQIDELESELAALCVTQKSYSGLLSVPGFGPIASAALVSEMGDGRQRELRTLLIHGARAVARFADKRNDHLGQWLRSVIARRGKHKAVVALANKLARIAWKVVHSDSRFDAGKACRDQPA